MASKTKVQSISFPNDWLYNEFHQYASERHQTFSTALLGLASTGLQFYKLFHNLLVEVVYERFQDYQKDIKFFRQSVEKLTKENEMLKKAAKITEHQLLCQRLQIEKGKKAADEYHRKWIEIKEKEGEEAADLFSLGYPYRIRK